jgi:hypothetical protein
MRIETDPMKVIRGDAEQRINEYYNGLAQRNLQRDHEHARKRALAAEPSAQEFVEIAKIEGVTPKALAKKILSSPDEAIVRGNERRKLIVAVRKASSPAEIEVLLRDGNIPQPTTPQ